ncbi:MAG TPA: glycosyltransferase 87 family protein [Pilimelia sp.]|nr:glycosyltransferase 87 family protein [Pilimelia sp.]HEX5740019.1 glycosyltransferase 87 family protein [Pilimelia sp.]
MRMRRAVVDLPGRSDGFVRGLSEAIGGPPGAHTAGADSPGGPWHGRFWTAARVVLALTCLTLVAHWVQKSPCMDGAWTDNVQYKYYCYTDVLALYFAEGLNQGKVPYLDHPVEYPVLTGAFMGLLGLPVHRLGAAYPGLNQGMWFYHANALVLGVLAVAAAGMLLAMRRRRPWDVALFALAPAMFISATVNWDLLSLFFAVAGLLAWSRSRPVLAGVLLGLGTAAKLWPGFLLVAILFVALRARALRPALAATGAGVLTWAAVNAPVMAANLTNWSRFLQLNRERPVDWGTLWYIGDHVPRGGGRYGLPVFQSLAQDIPTLNLVTYVLIALSWLAIGVLVVRAPQPPRLAQVAFLVVAAFLILNKVWSQQFVLWLLPLVVLARPRWWAFLAWQAAELCYFAAFYAELMGAGGKPVFPEGVFVLASALRLGTVALLCALVVREVLHPDRDAVRRTYGRDPDAGRAQPSRNTTAPEISVRVTV